MKYGDALPKSFNIPTSAFWLKKDLTEAGNPFRLVNIQAGDRVMDCGAYIGTFTAACIEQGAIEVACYEAAPKNAALLRANVEHYNGAACVHEAALTATDTGVVELTMSGFSGANSILPSVNRMKSITVKAVNFRQRLLAFNPTVVKMDLEGAEYDMLDSLQVGDTASVRTIFIEFHPINDRDVRIDRINKYLVAEGFTVLSTRRRAFIVTREHRE